LDYALKHSDADPDQVAEMFVRYISASGLHISTSEFISNLEQKSRDKQFCLDIIPLLRTGIDFDSNAAVEKVTSTLITRIDSAWETL
jgi:hypothetical protein